MGEPRREKAILRMAKFPEGNSLVQAFLQMSCSASSTEASAQARTDEPHQKAVSLSIRIVRGKTNFNEHFPK